jgi:two-component system sensor histidine kinase BaeS
LDPVRIREVLTNLADNAQRAMPSGGRLGFAVAANEAGVSVVVTDTGTGIAPEDLEQVFDRFHKGSASRGSGLGLTISRDLVEAHGGTITVTSEPEIGTSVRIDLPGPA